MKAATAVAKILKREGVEFLIGYPVNPIIEAAAEADIRTIIVRQERTGSAHGRRREPHTSGQRIGVFAMQHGPGHRERVRRRGPGLSATRCRSWSCPAATRAQLMNVPPNFNALLNFQHVTKWCEQVIAADASAGRHAARLHAGAQRPPAAGAGRDPVRRAATRTCPEPTRLHARAARCASAPTRRR